MIFLYRLIHNEIGILCYSYMTVWVGKLRMSVTNKECTVRNITGFYSTCVA